MTFVAALEHITVVILTYVQFESVCTVFLNGVDQLTTVENYRGQPVLWDCVLNEYKDCNKCVTL